MDMSNKVLHIDLDKWTTQQIRAEQHINTKTGKVGCSIQYINRLAGEGRIKTLPIPELNLVLVEKQ